MRNLSDESLMSKHIARWKLLHAKKKFHKQGFKVWLHVIQGYNILSSESHNMDDEFIHHSNPSNACRTKTHNNYEVKLETP